MRRPQTPARITITFRCGGTAIIEPTDVLPLLESTASGRYQITLPTWAVKAAATRKANKQKSAGTAEKIGADTKAPETSDEPAQA